MTTVDPIRAQHITALRENLRQTEVKLVALFADTSRVSVLMPPSVFASLSVERHLAFGKYDAKGPALLVLVPSEKAHIRYLDEISASWACDVANSLHELVRAVIASNHPNRLWEASQVAQGALTMLAEYVRDERPA